MMRKLEKIQSRKTMTAYGGAGSIIETMDNGSLLVGFYSEWGCFKPVPRMNRIPINDERLLKHLRKDFYLTNLETLLSIPTPEEANVFCAKKRDLREAIQSRYFPEWFYCPKCRRLHKWKQWETLWENKFPQDHKFRENYPACYHCSAPKGKGISRKPLEQIRFCMASLDSGRLEDVPFDLLSNFKDYFAKNQAIYYDVTNETPVADLKYGTTSNSEGLQSNYIRFGDGDNRLSFAAIASKYIVYGDAAFKIVLRNQNNIYYPTVVKGLFIPQDERWNKLAADIISMHNRGNSDDTISNALKLVKNIDISPAQVQNIIDGETLDFDMQEYAYITNAGNYNAGINKKDDEFYAMRYDNLKHPFVQKFYSILKLREDSTIPCFTRISNKNARWLNLKTKREEEMEPKPCSTYAQKYKVQDLTFIPAVSAYGEGIFMDIDTSHLPTDLIEKTTFVHTFSHIVMKELEFECGYSLQSLKEKIYKMEDENRFGILIYTIGGSEGSYGGLVSLLPTNVDAKEAKLIDIIDNALERAEDCPNDPICSMEGGHCFACVDIPEISCYDWNKNLDRRIVNKVTMKLKCQESSEKSVVTEDEQKSKDEQDDDDVSDPDDVVLS